jgi:amino acid adenylation domain-containing protein
MTISDHLEQGTGRGTLPDDVEDVYELTPMQQGILLHSLHGGDGDTYISQLSYEIEGPLDVDALLEAWQQTVAAHSVLRTSFHWDDLDKPLQVVHREAPIPVHRHDWTGIDAQQQRRRFDRLVTEDRQAGFFSLTKAPLQRLHLIKLGEDHHGYIWTHHMVILDGWSELIVINDVITRYQHLVMGGPPPVPAPPYRDYIAWLQRQSVDVAKAFWVANLGDGSSSGRLAPLLPAGAVPKSGAIAERDAPLSPTMLAQLRATAANHRVTFSTLVLAAWALVLQRYSGDAEVTFGCTSSGRPAELPAVDRMAGSFINSLPVRVAVPDDGDLGEWLRDIQNRASAIRRYEYAPLSQIKTWVGAGPDALFDTLIVLENFPSTVVLGEDKQRVSLRLLEAFEKTSEPLTLKVLAEPEPVIKLIYHRERLAPGSIDAIIADFRAAFEALCGAHRVKDAAAAMRPAEPGEQREAVTYPDAGQTLLALIERQAEANPGAMALLTDAGQLSYGELMARSRAVAEALLEANCGPGSVVGVCSERSFDMVTGILGCLYAGAAYLPLEPTLPPARLEFMVRDAGASVVLAQEAAAATAEDAAPGHVLILEDLPTQPTGRPMPRVGTQDAVYVMYTSGSTGRPKGVVITNEGIVNRLLWMQDTFRLTGEDRVLQKTPFGFDVSVWEIFWPLTVGASVVLARPLGHQDSDYLVRTIWEHAVTTAHFVPSMLQLFLEEWAASRLPMLRRVICSGEALPHSLAERFKSVLPNVELHNLYGPTEASVDVTWWDCAQPGPPGVIPIGHPIANTQAYVLDRRLTTAPVNVPGELYLGGVQLARGYVSRPGLTAASFVAHPFGRGGERLYRTGDRARRLPDGSIEFLGRVDHQVKIRGYRIELGEIEQVLVGHSRVREAAVVVVDGGSSPQLAAYVTGIPESDADGLRDYLRSRLPRYMVPATFTALPALPLTHNGKLDRAALPRPVRTAPVDQHQTIPATPMEERVAAAYRQVLGLDEIDLTASFFDLGGDSFGAVRAVRRLEGATVGLLAANQSVRELAAALDAPTRAGGVLVQLTRSEQPKHTIVCTPFGGGSAITFKPLADALSSGIELLAVSIPGHELGGDPELRPVEAVAEACVDELLKKDGPLSVYGHCVGSALAVEIVRRLEEAHRPVERFFIGGVYPFYEVRMVEAIFLRRAIDPSDEDEIRYVKSLGGFTGTVGDEELAFVMRAFRHDLNEGRAYFSRRWPRLRSVKQLSAPITFIASTDDPETPNYEKRYKLWERFSPSVELKIIPGGGHYFAQHQPRALARIIEGVLEPRDADEPSLAR